MAVDIVTTTTPDLQLVENLIKAFSCANGGVIENNRSGRNYVGCRVWGNARANRERAGQLLQSGIEAELLTLDGHLYTPTLELYFLIGQSC